ncbi:MAG: hypothetical protein JXA53_04045 [Bacteroidales bacterium]|nr:hypothetical protein [Bacteroidales bacterium]
MKLFLNLSLITALLFASCSKNTNHKLLESGVSTNLATFRYSNYSDIKYNLEFSIPKSVDQLISANVNIGCNVSEKVNIIIDFRANQNQINSVAINGNNCDYQFLNNHIIIDKKHVNKGINNVEINFTAGDMSLNRNAEYMYTLFVPDRASTAFPCFDQPDLKANYTLKLNVAKEWIAVSNAKVKLVSTTNDIKTIEFNESEKLSTYLFSFAAGIFNSTKLKYGEREINFYHRINDEQKLKRNLPEIERLIGNAISFCEDYTSVKYPFSNCDLIAIPSFQYGGMEHPGNIYYREAKLFLDESATQNNIMARANLISHETAHIWFGDLVTMKWFDQVWLKEVFANFIADKIVSKSFPNENYKLNFLLAHYPKSYEIDRTEGANAITTPLSNLVNAGSVYGNIIYHKAPIVMQQLELIAGKKSLQEGVKEYITKYAFSNATWSDLITILDKNCSQDLKQWSNSWVFKNGMATIEVNTNGNNGTITQTDKFNRNVIWPQSLKLHFPANAINDTTIFCDKQTTNFTVSGTNNNVCFPNSDGVAYGYFKLNKATINYIAENINTFDNELQRAICWINIWENYINSNVDNSVMTKLFTESLKNEKSDLLLSQICSYYNSYYWLFLNNSEQQEISPIIEELLITRIANQQGSIKYSLFNLLKKVFVTDNTYNLLNDIWESGNNNWGLKMSENDNILLCYELSLRNSAKADSIIAIQSKRIINNDNKKKFDFVSRALSSSVDKRNELFESFADESNRAVEPWVCLALQYLNHPLRADEAMPRIETGLNLLQEIQSTGDIFFPKSWLEALYSGANSKKAITITETFLQNNKNYPEHLKRKILQTTDMCKRASLINNVK